MPLDSNGCVSNLVEYQASKDPERDSFEADLDGKRSLIRSSERNRMEEAKLPDRAKKSDEGVARNAMMFD
jgi:hypothetical protein